MPETEVSRQVGRPERWEDLPHFSYTQLSTYLTCPRRYFYRYVQRREPEDVAAALLFGKAVHLTVATYYEAVMRGETPPSGEELAELFRAEWREAVDSPVPVLYPKGETAACLEKQGMAAVKAFRLWAQPQRVLGVEEPFEVELVDGDGTPLQRRLVGVFDLIEADEEGTP
ncbi:MAG: RecB family exonuclease, partial [Nitrospinota bacterium]